jgi:deoxyribonuclease-4
VEFGAHVSTAGGIDTGIGRIEAIGGSCVQVFTQSPRRWRPTEHEPEAIERFRAGRAEAGLAGVVCHALYLCNLAAPDELVRTRSVAALRATLATAEAIEADAVVFHVGSHLGSGLETGLDRAAAGLAEVLAGATGDTWVLMENSAGAGGTIGRSVGELARLLDALDRHPRLGICLDSCHLYASGYDVTDRGAVSALAAEIGETVGLERLRALHVNDSAASLGSNRDRHANILEGAIGKGMGAFLAEPAFQDLCAYLEVPGAGDGPDRRELDKVRRLHARATGAPPRRRSASRR